MDTGVVIDIETTGLDVRKDHIIEVGILVFCLDEANDPKIIELYSAMEDPGVSISEEITKITGITQPMVAGRKINWDYVRALLEKSSVVIAHNADFDIPFLLARQELAGLDCHYACSIKHIPWKKLGFKSQALNYLAADHGFVNPFAHRAVFDCATTFRLIAPQIRELIFRSYEREYLVHATNSPFETKDILKQRGYRWNADIRCWIKTVLSCDLEEERNFLAEEVYKNGTSRHQEFAQPGIGQ